MRLLLASLIALQAGAHPPAVSGAQFDVVSIKPNNSVAPSGTWADRPDGGFRAVGVTVAAMIEAAFHPPRHVSLVGLPAWTADRFDVQATSSRAHPTAEERMAMLQAMLADRFKLAAHLEERE